MLIYYFVHPAFACTMQAKIVRLSMLQFHCLDRLAKDEAFRMLSIRNVTMVKALFCFHLIGL